MNDENNTRLNFLAAIDDILRASREVDKAHEDYDVKKIASKLVEYVDAKEKLYESIVSLIYKK